MLYKRLTDLPDIVRRLLPAEGQRLYFKAYNEACRGAGGEGEPTGGACAALAHRAAWIAVKREFEPNGDASWRRRRLRTA